ncbi:MAG: hypothetical protein SFW65_08045 [Alphaproteobacteria bacterium]|nr:hypothetical protein [Alphaproteobacteria bacterium]
MSEEKFVSETVNTKRKRRRPKKKSNPFPNKGPLLPQLEVIIDFLAKQMAKQDYELEKAKMLKRLKRQSI